MWVISIHLCLTPDRVIYNAFGLVLNRIVGFEFSTNQVRKSSGEKDERN